MKRKHPNRVIGLLLSLVLTLGVAFTGGVTAFAADDNTLLDSLNITSEYGKQLPETTRPETVESNAELMFDASKTFDGLNIKKLDRSGSSPVDPEESVNAYIETVIDTLAVPAGALGFEDTSAGETVDVIVWLQDLPNALVEAYSGNRQGQISAYASAGSRARSSIKSAYASRINFEYSEVFSGFALTIPARYVDQIAAIPGVYAVTPDRMMYATSFTPDPDYNFVGMKESREALRIGEIQEEGITGEGVIVGVLDTGIDYNHPEFEGVYKGGWNFILASGDAGRPAEYKETPMETTYKQWQASGQPELDDRGEEYYTSHGTHVSGTIAAQGKNVDDTLRTLGIAPDVDLYVARVLGPRGSGPETGIIAAIDDFASDGGHLPKADVINLSLGSDGGTAYGSDVFALNNAVIAGVNVAVSAGNDAGDSMAERSTFTLGTPGTAYLPVTVAASQYGGKVMKIYNEVTATSDAGSATINLLVEGQDLSNTFEDNLILGNPSPLYVEGKGYQAYLAFGPGDTNPTEAQLAAIPDGSLEGQILVVKRGLDFRLFVSEAKRTGAGALIIVNRNNLPDEYITNMTVGGVRKDHIPLFSAFSFASAELAKLAAGGETVYLELGALAITEHVKAPAYYSSIGPVNETAGIKPDIIAPGWDIYSVQPAFIVNPDHDDTDYTVGYGQMGGTSMSSPHIAGILALLKQAYPEATPAELKARLMNTAEPDFINALPDGTPASVFEVGAGFPNPYRAIFEDTEVYVTVTDDIPGRTPDTPIAGQTLSSLSFGYTDAGSDTRELPVTVHNADDFEISVVYNNETRYSNDSSENGVVLATSVDDDNTIRAWVEIPEEAEEGLYEGRLVITVNGSDYSLPWAVYVGEAPIPFLFDFFSERPIVSTSTSTGVRSNTYANATTLFYMYDGMWPGGESDILLLDAETGDFAYYYGTLSFSGPGDPSLAYTVTGAISYQAYPIVDGYLIPTLSTIANGAYYIAMSVGDEVWYSSGIVFSNEAPTLERDPNVLISMNPSVTTVDIKGRIYSPALALAEEYGFTWDEYDYVMGGYYMPVDQSWNVLATNSTNIGSSSVISVGGSPYICDEDGYFWLTLSGITQANKTAAATILSNIVGLEGYDYNYSQIGTSRGWTLHGSNKSSPAVTLRLKAFDVLNSLTVTNGSINAAINVPSELAKSASKYTFAYTINGVPASATFGYSYNAAADVGTASWGFTPLDRIGDKVIAASVTYEGQTRTASLTLPRLDPYFKVLEAAYAPLVSKDLAMPFVAGLEIYAGVGIAGVKAGAYQLVEGQDYEVAGAELVLKHDFLISCLEKTGDKLALDVTFAAPVNTTYTLNITADFGAIDVTFESNGGSAVATATVQYNWLVPVPQDPVRAGYLFDGWFSDEACTVQWDFTAGRVRAPITLYAKWTKEIPMTGAATGNGQADFNFSIVSANGKGYTLYLSKTGEAGTFAKYDNVNYNSKGAHIKGLTNGETYFVYVEYLNSKNEIERTRVATFTLPKK